MPTKILITRTIPDFGIQMLKEKGFEMVMQDSCTPFSQVELIDAAKGFEAIISTSKEKLNAAFFKANPQLKVISQYAAGTDNIDIASATAMGIPIGHTPNAMNNATSDIAFGLMISVARDFFQQHKRIERNDYPDFKPLSDLGIELHGKTLGVFGMGAIGQQMARKCQAAYEMKVIYCNRSPKPKAKELNAQFVDFDTLLMQSDIVSIHADLNPSTKGLFNSSAFGKMKNTAIIINTSRGGLVNEADLVNALVSKQIFGAGLDVQDPEPMWAGHPLLQLPHVCVLPHIGSGTVEERTEMSRLVAENMIRFYEDGSMTHCVNREVLA